MNNIRFWLHGLTAAAIGGAATALATYLAQDAAKANFSVMGKTAAVGALFTAAGYLKQSPLPPKQ